jgi:hypothetical protein
VSPILGVADGVAADERPRPEAEAGDEEELGTDGIV